MSAPLVAATQTLVATLLVDQVDALR